jgi:hypothetical protein
VALAIGFEIRAAGERGMNLNNDLAGFGTRDWHLNQAQITRSVKENRSHRRPFSHWES